jgi:RNA polymerase sigma-70 factor (ECF subfamily)
MKRLESPAAESPRAAGNGQLTEAEAARETVERVLAGDPGAFRSLVEAHERAVFGLCRRLLYGNETEAEDLTQETFLRAYKYLGRLDDRSRFAPWLYQIARSLCRDRRRRIDLERRAIEARVETLRRKPLQSAEYAPEGAATGPVTLALSDLPADEREALMLRYFHGLSYDEIAQRYQLSFSQVDHLIRRARARLARRLLVRERVEPK